VLPSASTDLLACLEAARRNILHPHGLGEAVEDRTVDQSLNSEMVQVFGIRSSGLVVMGLQLYLQWHWVSMMRAAVYARILLATQ
jgi:hypothetical protein